MANTSKNTKLNSKNPKKSQKRKLNSKGKNFARKLTAGLLLSTALIVAAIPEDRSGNAKAGKAYEELNYSADSGEARNGDFVYDDLKNNELDPTGKLIRKSYQVMEKNEGSGDWSLTWQYEYYNQKIGGENIGVISKYNDNSNNPKLNLTEKIITSYEVVYKEDFNDYISKSLNGKQFTLNVSPYYPGVDDGTHEGATVDFFVRYYNSEYEEWKNRYDQALINYKDRYKQYVEEQIKKDSGYNENIDPEILGHISMEPLVVTGDSMSNNNKLIYYCDNNKSHNNEHLNGCTLVQVTNLTSEGDKFFENNDYKDIIPSGKSSDWVYVVKKVDGSATVHVDDNDFMINGDSPIGAISNGAFANTQRVDEIKTGTNITLIGDEAFYNSFIQDVNFDSVTYIGNRVFKKCEKLKQINLSNSTTSIGKEAFADCSVLGEIKITGLVKEIGFGAFSGCTLLKKADFSATQGCNIGEYAFFDCANLTEVVFPSGDNASFRLGIGKAAFAMSPGSNSSMTEFKFPSNIDTYHSYTDKTFKNTVKNQAGDTDVACRLGDYILANRIALKTVIMPEDFGSNDKNPEYIPLNTFKMCQNMNCLKFDQYQNQDAYFDPDIFKDIQNSQFYVFGPERSNNDYNKNNKYYAYPRISTWGSHLAEGVSDYVPYVYRDSRGIEHFEVGIDKYRYELEVDSNTGTAKLQRCEFTKDEGPIDLIVPGQVSSYTITDMEPGCYNSLKDYLRSVTVADNSITTIGDNVFNGCKDLSFVWLGNSVKTIGDNSFSDNDSLKDVRFGENIESIGNNAFANCPELLDVYFAKPSSNSTLYNIGNNAFKTESPILTMHGVAEKGYLPFEYAMGPNKINNDSVRICYDALMIYADSSINVIVNPSVTNPSSSEPTEFKKFKDTPQNFRMILNEDNNEITLIDYPHFEDLPVEVREKFLKKDKLNDEDNALINNTMYLKIPDCVDSIDVVSFLTSPDKNSKNYVYLNNSYPNGTKNSVDYENNNEWIDVYSKISDEDAVPGLFSGYMLEAQEIDNDSDPDHASDYDKRGNDWIKSVEMKGVKSIPDYAFDSCERLESVIIGDNTSEIGIAAFRDCSKLNTVGTGNNPKYFCENSMLYENAPNGELILNTCLPGKEDFAIDTDSDPNLKSVTKINPGAFQNCENLLAIDLSKVPIDTIYEDTFDGCSSLNEIKLGENVGDAFEGAFTGCSDGLRIEAPCDVSFQQTAFDKDKKYIIYTYLDGSCKRTEAAGKFSGYNIKISDLNKIEKYTITFLYDDQYTEYAKLSFPKIDDDPVIGRYPNTSKNPVLPKLAKNQGKEFVGWRFIGVPEDEQDTVIENLVRDYEAYAEFGEPAPQPSQNPNPSGSNAPVPSGSGAPAPSGSNAPTPSGTLTPTASPTSSAAPGASPSSNPSSSASPAPTSSNTPSTNGFNVIVENGAGSGKYEQGKVVTITAYSPVQGQVFDRWTTSNSDIGFSDAFGVSTTFIMPTHDVKVTATYKLASASANSPSPSSSAAPAGNTPKPAASGEPSNPTPNATPGDRSGETDVTVTTDTIDNNKKNLASAQVSGSTDNFIVKVTDSAQASALVEQALRNKFGDRFGDVKYVAFDISLYDETGAYLIENSNDLAVTITLPIPDDLVSYAGNNRVGVAINGQLDEKAVKFTTIDGVPCMTFTATHFSPYTIFVDTQNLTGGVMDTTPKTGDGIAPKWFVVIGLSCLSGVLFLWKDNGGKRKKAKLA